MNIPVPRNTFPEVSEFQNVQLRPVWTKIKLFIKENITYELSKTKTQEFSLSVEPGIIPKMDSFSK